jgi:hypothetical protein
VTDGADRAEVVLGTPVSSSSTTRDRRARRSGVSPRMIPTIETALPASKLLQTRKPVGLDVPVHAPLTDFKLRPVHTREVRNRPIESEAIVGDVPLLGHGKRIVPSMKAIEVERDEGLKVFLIPVESVSAKGKNEEGVVSSRFAVADLRLKPKGIQVFWRGP